METEELYEDDSYLDVPADAGAPVRNVIKTTHHDDDRPATVRIAELLERMQPHRPILMAILNGCAEKPYPFTELSGMVEKMSVHHRSVYSPAGFCDLLERSGAIQKVTVEGEPFPTEEPEPRVVVEDGVEYLEPVEMPELHYLMTEDGKQAMAEYNPMAKIEKLFEGETRYLPVYKRVLEMCAQDGGSTMPKLDAAIVDHPLVQSPRMYASRFVTFLESVDAIAWESGWHITDAGLESLEMLRDIETA